MKIMLDECMTKKASLLLISALGLHKPAIEAVFLEDFLGQKGSLDPDWTQVLADEGGWVVITCDCNRPKGQKAKLKGPPLHLILPYRKITGFFLGGNMSQRAGFEKARSVLCVFSELWHQADTAAPGTRFKITPNGSGYRMAEWPMTVALPADLLPAGPWKLS